MNLDGESPSDQPDGDAAMPASRRARISLILGGLAFLALFFFPFVSIILGVPAATNGVLARREIASRNGPADSRAIADYGLASGVVSAVFGIVVLSWDIFT